MVSSEFGRTPKINATAGRDHWPKVFSVVLAGGGIKKGFIYGKSDATASEPDEDGLTVEDLAHTVYHCLGIDARQEADVAGRPAHRHRPRGPHAQGSAGVRRIGHKEARRDTEEEIQDSHDTRLRISLAVLLFVSLRASLWPISSAPLPRSAASSRAGRSAAPRPSSPSPAAASPTRRKFSSTTPASASRSSKSSTPTTLKVTAAIAPDCRLGEHAFRVRTATGISRSSHVLGRRAAGGRGSGTEQRVRQAAADPAERHRSRRRAGRGPGLLRRRVQEGAAAFGRSRRDAARRHVLRPVRRHSRREAVRAGDRRRLAAVRAGRRLFGRGPGRRQVHRSDSRERLRRQRLVPVSAAHRQLPAADRRGPGGRQARARSWKSRSSATRPGRSSRR